MLGLGLSIPEIAVRGGDPWASIDGRTAAPSGAANYPTYFTSLNGITAYPVRPPWKVAGVDYRVGINTGVSLKNPTTVPPADGVAGSSLGAGQNAQTLQVQRACTLDGYDFTLGGGWTVVTNGFNVTISNSKLQNFCAFAASSSSTLTMLYNQVDGLGASGETSFGTLVLMQNNVKGVFQYNWFKNSENDVIDMTTQDVDLRFNLFDTMAYQSGAHADAIQFAGDGTANNIKIMFNTYVHNAITASGPSSFIDIETQSGSVTQVMNNPEVAYNTASYTGGTAGLASTFFRIIQDSSNIGTIVNAFVHDNYADPNNMLITPPSNLSVIADITNPGTGYQKSGNKLLTTGGSF